VAGASAQRAATTPEPTGELFRVTLPDAIRVVDEEKREIEVCATSEAVDGHGTVFDYAASKDAFGRWAGNVREMHERKAVGRRVAVRYDDETRRVFVRLRISAGAQDTWEKVKDGTLAGASIGASNVEWRTQRRAVGDVPVAVRYDLVELSLVDLASNPDASGITFVRDGVPDAALLESVDVAQDAAQDVAPDAAQIREGAGNLGADDVAAAIAAAALARGQQALAQVAAQDTFSRRGDVAAGQNGSGLRADESWGGEMFQNAPHNGATAKQKRLAALGAPGYVTSPVARPEAAQTRAMADGADEAPGAMFDDDGDHDANMDHAEDQHAHDAHEHAHTGSWDDAHTHGGAHMHEDGTSHEHDHAHDHGHHDHSGMRAQAGHSHAHVHAHDHGHYYRVADGAPTDERLVSGEQARTREYVSEVAFRAAGGVAGVGLSAAQFRVAAGVELRMELAAADAAVRAQGAFSRNPSGAADFGTPAPAQEAPTGDTPDAGAVAGAVRPLDRDGKPTSETSESSTGTLNVSAAPDGWAELTERRMADAVTAAMEAQMARALAPLTEIQQRLARIEAQPQAGGPIFRTADKATALSAMGGGGSPSTADHLRALESLAGRIADPQAQVAVAAEMIRLQQEAAGMPAAMQVMPRAGRGWRASDE